MKKTLIAAALATGFAGVAQAQTSVTLFGVLDTGVGYTQYELQGTGTLRDLHHTSEAGGGTVLTPVLGKVKAKKSGLVDGVQAGNRWGLRGSEDLGSGLKVVFHLESGYSLLNGASQQGNRLFGRQAWLGLENDTWGKVAFGRQLNFGSMWVGGVAVPWNDSFAGSNSGRTFTSTGTVRLDNMLSYTSPVFSGFQFGAGYSFHNSGAPNYDVNITPNPKDNNIAVTTVGLRYNSGPLAVAASYDHADINSSTFVPPLLRKDIKAWVLAGSYDFGMAKLHLGVGQERNGVFTERGEVIDGLFATPLFGMAAYSQFPGYKTSNYSVGVGVPISADSNVAVAWQTSRLGNGTYKTNVELLTTLGKTKQNLYSVVYTHKLSPRTNLYANVGYGDGIAFNDVKMTRAVVGLRHQF